jgi:hypothetical protein
VAGRRIVPTQEDLAVNDQGVSLDALIERLRARAMDPERRADVVVDSFSASVRAMDLGSLLGATRSVASDLGRLLGEIRAAGTPGPASRARADEIGRAMESPATPDLPSAATEAAVAEAESELGGELPSVVRRAYREIADGGFGPGAGLLGIAAALGAYRELRREPPGPRGSKWPAGLLPIVAMGPGYDCLEVPSGRIVGWDPEGLTERAGDAAWQRSFSELAPSAEAWLTTWVGSRTQKERTAELLAAGRVKEARLARARIAAMTPEQRAAMGLPAVGWERVVWGGIGLDEDEE